MPNLMTREEFSGEQGVSTKCWVAQPSPSIEGGRGAGEGAVAGGGEAVEGDDGLVEGGGAPREEMMEDWVKLLKGE